MIPSTLFAAVAALSSFAAVNGAVIQRDGTFTYLTPQPTAPGQASTTSTTTTSTSSRPSTTTSIQSTTSITSGTTATSITPTTTSTNTGTTSVTVTLPTTTSTTSVSVMRPTTSTNTGTTTTATVIPPITTSATTTSPVTTSAPGAANCNGIQKWQASFAYTAGDQVIFNGQLFTARQWTYDNAPNAHPDQWISWCNLCSADQQPG
ncbi:hypothetical protein J3R82DRAFT_6745 [Butyriboletus roseoflavus]|nr:hypothetical protein J3R82DRAFT_6745 [Butyriboletus roseoflavus]